MGNVLRCLKALYDPNYNLKQRERTVFHDYLPFDLECLSIKKGSTKLKEILHRNTSEIGKVGNIYSNLFQIIFRHDQITLGTTHTVFRHVDAIPTAKSLDSSNAINPYKEQDSFVRVHKPVKKRNKFVNKEGKKLVGLSRRKMKAINRKLTREKSIIENPQQSIKNLFELSKKDLKIISRLTHLYENQGKLKPQLNKFRFQLKEFKSQQNKLESQLNELRSQLEELEIELNELESQRKEMKTKLKELRSQLEKLEYQLNELKTKLESHLDDLESQRKQLESQEKDLKSQHKRRFRRWREELVVFFEKRLYSEELPEYPIFYTFTDRGLNLFWKHYVSENKYLLLVLADGKQHEIGTVITAHDLCRKKFRKEIRSSKMSPEYWIEINSCCIHTHAAEKITENGFYVRLDEAAITHVVGRPSYGLWDDWDVQFSAVFDKLKLKVKYHKRNKFLKRCLNRTHTHPSVKYCSGENGCSNIPFGGLCTELLWNFRHFNPYEEFQRPRILPELLWNFRDFNPDQEF
ncbi:hypothetical protein CRE_13736 [Caenorhabditis remanei]|uniref:Uncharacterized protein n=1 Tax=Caenorhabditis remanei TaxID=31234 RepID=E3NEW5_CAERE|nr:hypothetical protein CRE_13736 [Caenorhabditis remanei]